MTGDFAAMLIALAVASAVFLIGWAIAAGVAKGIRMFRMAAWTRGLYIASERPETLATVIPMLLDLGLILDPDALQAQMPRRVRRFIDSPSTEVEVVETGAIAVVNELELDLTPAAENDMYFAAAQEAWARVRELEDQVLLLEADRDYKDELRARHLRRVRRIEEALEDPEADVYAAAHPFLARVSGSEETQA